MPRDSNFPKGGFGNPSLVVRLSSLSSSIKGQVPELVGGRRGSSLGSSDMREPTKLQLKSPCCLSIRLYIFAPLTTLNSPFAWLEVPLPFDTMRGVFSVK